MSEYWYNIISQIIKGEQEELKKVMLDQISEWCGEKINSIDDLTIGEIKSWLIDCQEEIELAGLLK